MKHSMLVTDDDPSLLTLYRHLFANDSELRIDYASTPAACKELVAHRKYDLALLDISLGDPQLDGFELLSIIRRKSPDTEVLMMSSMDNEATIDRCRELGARMFASKNDDFPRRIRRQVREWLDQRSTRSEEATELS